jgi:hypothetical protein
MTELDCLFNELDYHQRCSFYFKHFSMGSFNSKKLKDKMLLIGLLCFVTFQMRKKEGLITVRSVLEKILGKILTGCTGFEESLIGLCIICEDLLYNCEECDSFGLKTPQEVITKIKELLSEWNPF